MNKTGRQLAHYILGVMNLAFTYNADNILLFKKRMLSALYMNDIRIIRYNL